MLMMSHKFIESKFARIPANITAGVKAKNSHLLVYWNTRLMSNNFTAMDGKAVKNRWLFDCLRFGTGIMLWTDGCV